MTALSAIRKAGSRRCPVPLRVLARMCGLSPRATKAAVQRLRRRGYPVASSRDRANGYYLERTSTSQYADKLRREAVSRLVTLARMTSSARVREYLGQIRLEGA